MLVQRCGEVRRLGPMLSALYSVGGVLIGCHASFPAFAMTWPRQGNVALADRNPMELCTNERMDALAAASFGHLMEIGVLQENLAKGLDDTPLLHVRPEAPWFAVVASRIRGRG